jgi:hypothetical protein
LEDERVGARLEDERVGARLDAVEVLPAVGGAAARLAPLT